MDSLTQTIPDVQELINGIWSTPGATLPGAIRDPNTGADLSPIYASTPAQVEAALTAAWAAHQSANWPDLPAGDRVEWLERIAARAEDHLEEIARLDALTTGAVITLTRQVAMIVKLAFHAAAGQLRSGWLDGTIPGLHGDVEVLRRPWGPAALIVPWNAPSGLAAHKIANALAAGAPAILKPSEVAPHSSYVIARIIHEAGLPAGMFNIVYGGAEGGAALVSDRRVKAVSFTGGLSGGRAVAAACAVDFKPAQLELGGNNALVVLDDADLDQVASGIAAGMITLNGQWCRAIGRVLVHESQADELLERALGKLAAVRIGHSLDEKSEMGPLVHRAHFDHVSAAIRSLESAGGHIHQSTPLPDLPGTFLAPTLITGCDPADTLEEIFGPVAAVHTFSSEAEAIELANQAPYGLGGYVFGRDEARALRVARQMQTGGVKVNGVSLMSLNPMAPRPAWGLSGIGEEGTAETFRFFCGTRVVGVAG